MKTHFVTLIVPVRNEGRFIARSLGAILAQDYPPEKMEILIADGMSTDDTRAVIRELAAQHPQWKVEILDNPGKIVPTGMNLALKQAKGEIIIRVDGHTIIPPDYVRRCAAHLQTGEFQGAGGWVETIGETKLARAIAAAMSAPFGVGNSAMRITREKNVPDADTVPFPAYTREITQKAGGYDEELVRNQDDEYNYRIRKLGGRLLLAGDVWSQWHSRATLSGLWRQYYQYGFYKVRVLQKHPRQMSWRQFVPPAFALTLFLSALCELPLFSFFHPFDFAQGKPSSFVLHPLPLVLLLYLSANLAASIHTAAKHQWKHLPLLPVVFAILHLSYGLGFLAGLFKFWNRWGDKTGKVPSL